MTKQEYINSLTTDIKTPVEMREEKVYLNGDKVYVADCRHIDGDKVFYMEERFVVINEGQDNEQTYKM